VASLIAGFVGMSYAQPGSGGFDMRTEAEKTMAEYRFDFCSKGWNLVNKKKRNL